MRTTEFRLTFLTGIYLSDALAYNSYVFSLVLHPNTENPNDQTIALERIQYFIDGIVSGAVFVNEIDMDSIIKLTNADIPVLTVPYPGPADQIIQEVLTTKIYSIIESTFEIYETKISSMLGEGMIYSFVFDDDDDEENEEFNNPYKWWNITQPLFVNQFFDEDDVPVFESLTWDELGLGWDTEYETVEVGEEDSSEEKEEEEKTDNIICLNISQHDN